MVARVIDVFEFLVVPLARSVSASTTPAVAGAEAATHDGRRARGPNAPRVLQELLIQERLLFDWRLGGVESLTVPPGAAVLPLAATEARALG